MSLSKCLVGCRLFFCITLFIFASLNWTIDPIKVLADTPAPGVVPINPGPNGYFEFNAVSGGIYNSGIIVKNLSNVTTSFITYPVYGTTSPLTGVSYSNQNQDNQGVAAWIKLSNSSIQLAPFSDTTVKFTATVPLSTPAGDYVGGIAVAPKDNSSTQNNSGGQINLNVQTRVIVAAVFHVLTASTYSVKLASPYFGELRNQEQVLYLPMNDTGNRLMKPELNLIIRPTGSSHNLVDQKKQLDTFVPKTSIDYPYYLGNVVLAKGCYFLSEKIYFQQKLIGYYQASPCVSEQVASVKPPSHKQSNKSTMSPSLDHSTFVIVSLLIIMILLLLGLVLWLILLLKRRKDDEEKDNQKKGSA